MGNFAFKCIYLALTSVLKGKIWTFATIAFLSTNTRQPSKFRYLRKNIS